MQTFCENLSSVREATLDFSFKCSVGKKGFDGFDNLQWSFEDGQFVKKAFVLDSMKYFVYVEKY